MTSLTTAAGSRRDLCSWTTSIVQREVVKQRDKFEDIIVRLTTSRVLLCHSSSSHVGGRSQQQQPRAWRPSEAWDGLTQGPKLTFVTVMM